MPANGSMNFSVGDIISPNGSMVKYKVIAWQVGSPSTHPAQYVLNDMLGIATVINISDQNNWHIVTDSSNNTPSPVTPAVTQAVTPAVGNGCLLAVMTLGLSSFWR